jgi:prolyl oligopeptidase
MKRYQLSSRRLTGLGAVLASVVVASLAGAVPSPPSTRVDSTVDTLHGVAIPDPYRWLEDQTSPETRAWIDAQNAYSHSLLDTIAGRDKLKARFGELFKMDQCWVRKFAGDTYLLSKRKADDAFSSIYMRTGLNGADQLLIDPLTLSRDSSVTPGIAALSDDGLLMSYQLRHGGEDETVVKFKNLATKVDLTDSLPRALYFGVELAVDTKGVYYGVGTKEGPRVKYHAFGTDPTADPLLFGEQFDDGWEMGIDLSVGGQYLVLVFAKGSSADETEIYVKDLSTDGPFVTVVKGVAARFEPIPADNKLFIKTNWQAPNSRIMVTDLASPAFENWKELVPTSDLVLEDVTPASGMLFVKYLDSVKTRIKAYQPDGTYLRDLQFPTIGMTGSTIGEWSTNHLFVTFGSFTYPWTQFKFDLKTWESTIVERVKIPLDPDKFVVKQIWYSSKDGTKVPMFVVHAKDTPLDGNRPVYMTGYGGFNNSMPPMFSQWAIVWMEHGGVYVLVNLRGGGEFGESWHTAGMLEKKQNVFDDLYAGAEWLIANKYTKPSRIAVEGGSNGGLLVGAALTQRPDLFGAVVCTYPLLDMVRYHKFLVAKYWVPEYGSADDPAQFQYLFKYSPYHNVKKGTKYPAVLFETGDADTRVAPLHARKMAAQVQANTGSDNPVLLLYDTKAGHSGGRSYDRIIANLVDQFSFLFWQLDMSQ